jgi:hypothetical protein
MTGDRAKGTQMAPILDGTADLGSWQVERDARITNAISRLADWLNDLAVRLFDLAGWVRGGAR